MRIDCTAAARWMLMLVAVVVAVLFRLKGTNDDLVLDSFGQDMLLSTLVLLLLSSSVVPLGRAGGALARFQRGAVFFSNFSFTLYVVHVPVLGLLHHLGFTLLGRRLLDPADPADLALYFGMLGFVLLFAYGFYRLFEARTYAVRRFLKNLLLRNIDVNPRAAPAKH